LGSLVRHGHSPHLLTVGHGTTAQDELAGLFQGASVELVVDVRSVPAAAGTRSSAARNSRCGCLPPASITAENPASVGSPSNGRLAEHGASPPLLPRIRRLHGHGALQPDPGTCARRSVGPGGCGHVRRVALVALPPAPYRQRRHGTLRRRRPAPGPRWAGCTYTGLPKVSGPARPAALSTTLLPSPVPARQHRPGQLGFPCPAASRVRLTVLASTVTAATSSILRKLADASHSAHHAAMARKTRRYYQGVAETASLEGCGALPGQFLYGRATTTAPVAADRRPAPAHRSRRGGASSDYDFRGGRQIGAQTSTTRSPTSPMTTRAGRGVRLTAPHRASLVL